MRKRDVGICLALLGLIAAGVGGSIWLRHLDAEARPLAGVPPIPDVSRWPNELATELQGATASARAHPSPDTLAPLAALYHANGLLAPAATVLRRLRELNPVEGRWAYRLADVAMRQGDIATNGRELEAAVRLVPGYSPAWLKLAYWQTEHGQAKQARESYARAVQAAPGDIRALCLQLAFEVRYGNPRAVQGPVEALARNHPRVSEVRKLLADLRSALGDEAGARQAQRAAAKAETFLSTEDPWMDELAVSCYDVHRLSQLGSEAAQELRYSAALGYLRRAVALAPTEASFRLTLASIHEKSGDMATAEEILRAGIRDLPEAVELSLRLAQLYCVAAQPERAVALLLPLAAQRPAGPGVRAALGTALNRVGRHREAEENLRAAIALDRNQADTRYELAACLLALGRRDEASESASGALTLRPDYREALVLAASLALEGEDLFRAKAPISRLIELDPETMPVPILVGTFQLLSGVAAQEAGRRGEAIEFFRRGRDAAPAHAALQRQAGLFLQRLHEPAEAAVAWSRVVQLMPDDLAAFGALAEALTDAGRVDEARRALTAGQTRAERLGDAAAQNEFRRLLEK